MSALLGITVQPAHITLFSIHAHLALLATKRRLHQQLHANRVQAGIIADRLGSPHRVDYVVSDSSVLLDRRQQARQMSPVKLARVQLDPIARPVVHTQLNVHLEPSAIHGGSRASGSVHNVQRVSTAERRDSLLSVGHVRRVITVLVELALRPRPMMQLVLYAQADRIALRVVVHPYLAQLVRSTLAQELLQ